MAGIELLKAVPGGGKMILNRIMCRFWLGFLMETESAFDDRLKEEITHNLVYVF